MALSNLIPTKAFQFLRCTRKSQYLVRLNAANKYKQGDMNVIRLFGDSTSGSRDVLRRTFATAAGKAKKGGKGCDALKASSLSKEIKSTMVVGANTLKHGSDPKILPDSDYPDSLWHLLDKQPALSELTRKNVQTLPFEHLKRFLKLHTRARIRDNNSIKAKN